MKSETLSLVVPVYNEQDAIGDVLRQWCRMLDGLGIDYGLYAYNDGSKDNTLQAMTSAAEEIGNGRIHIVDKPNSGHGPTILRGYRERAAESTWTFQMDSDNEMGPETFGELWKRREQYSFLLGSRDGREQAFPRKVMSFVSRQVVRIFYGKTVWDVNSPYRLMKNADFAALFPTIPDSTFAPNLIVSGYVGLKGLSFTEIPVPHQNRQTGEVSIKKWKLFKAGVKALVQTVSYRFRRHHEGR